MPGAVKSSGAAVEADVQVVERQSTVPNAMKEKQPPPSAPAKKKHKHKRTSSSSATANLASPPRTRSSHPSSNSSVSSLSSSVAQNPVPHFQRKYAMTRRLSPFWSSPRGYATMALVVLVIVGAIVGASVGTVISNREDRRAEERERAAQEAASGSGAMHQTTTRSTFSVTFTKGGKTMTEMRTMVILEESTARERVQPTGDDDQVVRERVGERDFHPPAPLTTAGATQETVFAIRGQRTQWGPVQTGV